VEGEDSFSIFIQAIPYNFYALLTLVFMIAAILLKVEYGPMKAKENAVIHMPEPELAAAQVKSKGKVMDLVIPIVVLIACCLTGMLYTGGFFSGASFIEAFSGCDASLSLVLGSVVAIIFTVIFYMCRRILNLRDAMACLPEGFKAMVPAILILTFAWTLKGMTDSMGAAVYVEALVDGSAKSLMGFLPAIIFLIGCFLAFATGTSWGTFGILIPIVVNVFAGVDHTMMIISISACMAGAVCGDHCSPISDTTIMASAGAQCDHVNHVSTQLPYAITVAVISFVVYLLAGFVKSAWICLPIGVVLVIGFLLVVKYNQEISMKSQKAKKA
jgi:Na+/H+ antiporter NhaC